MQKTTIDITPAILWAIKMASIGLGSQNQLSEQSHVRQSTLNMISNGKTKSITSATWERLYPFIREFLPEDTPAPSRPMLRGDFVPGSEAEPAQVDRLRRVPVLSVAQAAGYEPALEPLCDYLRETSDESALFMDVKDNYFALRISGDSMAPDYPDGTVALVAAGEYPQRGDLVVAKIAATGQVVVKEYHRKDNIITLRSLNPAGKSFEWHCKDQPGFVQWMWPVVEVTLKLRDRRWANAITGNGNGYGAK